MILGLKHLFLLFLSVHAASFTSSLDDSDSALLTDGPRVEEDSVLSAEVSLIPDTAQTVLEEDSTLLDLRAYGDACSLFNFLGDLIDETSKHGPDMHRDVEEMFVERGGKPISVLLDTRTMTRIMDRLPTQLKIFDTDLVTFVQKSLGTLIGVLGMRESKADAETVETYLRLIKSNSYAKYLLRGFVLEFSEILNQQLLQLDIVSMINIKVLIGKDRGFRMAILGDLFDSYMRVDYFKQRMGAGYLKALPIRSSFLPCTPAEQQADEDRARKEAMIKGGPGLHKLMQLMAGKMGDVKLRTLLGDFKHAIPRLSDVVISRILKKAFGTRDHLVSLVKELDLEGAYSASVAMGVPILFGKQEEPAFMKIKRPDIRTALEYELQAVTDVALNASTPENPAPKTAPFLYDIFRGWLDELDWYQEVKNIELGQQLYGNKVPRLLSIRCRLALPEPDPIVLVLSKAEGEPLSSYLKRDNNQQGLMEAFKLSGKLFKLWFEEALFGTGHFHADLHDGNLIFDQRDPVEQSTLTIIDYGSMKQLSKDTQQTILQIISHAWCRNAPAIVQVLRKHDVKMTFNWNAFEGDLAALLGRETPVNTRPTDDNLPPSQLGAIVDLIEGYPEMPLPTHLIHFIRSLVMLETFLIHAMTKLSLPLDHPLSPTSLLTASLCYRAKVVWCFGKSVCRMIVDKCITRPVSPMLLPRQCSIVFSGDSTASSETVANTSGPIAEAAAEPTVETTAEPNAEPNAETADD